MRKIFAAACLISCCSQAVPAFAQRVVTGTVYDNNNELLPGVSVVVKEQDGVGTLADVKGNYSLTLPDNKECTIEVSCIGYDPQSRKVKPGQSGEIDFRMKESPVSLDVVVVTGTRTPRLLKDSPIITKVITERDIKKADVTHIGELLQSELPGVEFSYSMNQQVSLNMQGFGGNSVLFLVDGERIAGETLNNIDYSRLNLNNVERIEIIKGAASSLYGSNAMGGVVNIIGKTRTEPWAVNLNTRFASHNEQRHGGTASFRSGRFNNTLNVQRASLDGYKMKNEGDYSEVFGNRSRNVREHLRYSDGRLTLAGRAGFFFRERYSQATSKDRYRGYSGGVKGQYIISGVNNVELAYSFDQYDKSDYYLTAKNDVRDYSNVQHSLRALYNYSFGDNNTLTAGGDYMRDYLMSYQFKENGSHRQYTADVFVQLDWTFSEKFNVITGLRHDYFSENNINRISPKLGLMYKLEGFTLRGSYAAGFRAPTLKEMYMNFDMNSIFMIYGNTDLKSESSHNFSLSGEYSKKYYNFSITGYYSPVDNRITTAWDQELNGMVYTNTRRVNIAGVDANASVKLPYGISGRLSYTYTHEYVKKGEVLISDTRPHTATSRVEYGRSWRNYGFNISLSGRFLSKLGAYKYTSLYTSNEVRKVNYPGYTMWKLSLAQNIRKGISVTLGVDNLFNYVPSYYYRNSPYTTGTTFSAGVSLDIERLFE